jgi:hypothetical protein
MLRRSTAEWALAISALSPRGLYPEGCCRNWRTSFREAVYEKPFEWQFPAYDVDARLSAFRQWTKSLPR